MLGPDKADHPACNNLRPDQFFFPRGGCLCWPRPRGPVVRPAAWRAVRGPGSRVHARWALPPPPVGGGRCARLDGSGASPRRRPVWCWLVAGSCWWVGGAVGASRCARGCFHPPAWWCLRVGAPAPLFAGLASSSGFSAGLLRLRGGPVAPDGGLRARGCDARCRRCCPASCHPDSHTPPGLAPY